MPLLINNTTYRTFDAGHVFESEAIAAVRQVYEPVDKSYLLMAADDGSNGLSVWKFDLNSTAADDGVTVLQPANPQYAASGRWILVGTSTQTGGAGGIAGIGSPEGVVTAAPGTIYTDTLNLALYSKITGTGNTGWQVFVS